MSRWIKLASKFSRKSTFPNYKMGAVVEKGGRLITYGINYCSPGSLKHSAYQKRHGVHAELDALLGMDPELLRGSTIYVAGETKAGNLVLSRPCNYCYKVLQLYGVKKIVFHDREGRLFKETV